MEKEKDYIVIYPFFDMQDKSKRFPNGKVYAIGDIYSNKNRIKELSTKKNKIGKQLIKLNKNEPLEQPESDKQEPSNVIVYDNVTKADIGQLLSDKGIEYNKRDNKQELYDLLLGSE